MAHVKTVRTRRTPGGVVVDIYYYGARGSRVHIGRLAGGPDSKPGDLLRSAVGERLLPEKLQKRLI